MFSVTMWLAWDHIAEPWQKQDWNPGLLALGLVRCCSPPELTTGLGSNVVLPSGGLEDGGVLSCAERDGHSGDCLLLLSLQLLFPVGAGEA